MPIVIPQTIPAYKVLERENIFVMTQRRAESQDIRPLEIAILNLMPTKIETETQLMRLLSNTPLQVNITLVETETYKSSHTARDHMERFYKTFDSIKDKMLDGLVVTGAPVETLEFDNVHYWEELKMIMDYADKNVTSTIFICWGAQAALFHYYGIGKKPLPKKMFGVFRNSAQAEFEPLLKGLDDTFYIPHSRHTTVDEEAVRACRKLKVIASGDECGLSIVKSADNRKFFFFGHSEYDRETLKNEYLRDLNKGLAIDPPKNYFIDGDIERINLSWRSTANLMFYNWLNYYVYQVTPYLLEKK